MTDHLVQIGLAVFGLASVFMAMSQHPTARKWAPVVGLAGQPFWLYFALRADAWGLMVTVAAFTGVYATGLYTQWMPKLPPAEAPLPDPEAMQEALEAHERQQKLVLLAGAIADDAAIEDVLTNCPSECLGGRYTWYDVQAAGDAADIAHVKLSVSYLDLRGWIVRHPQQPHLVRIPA